MNLKNLTIEMIAALTYEIAIKLSRLSMPSLFKTAPIPGIASLLSFLVGIIIILFLFSFYREERSDNTIALVLQLIIGCMILHFILRWPVTQRLANYQSVRLAGEIVDFIQAMLYVVLLLVYQRKIPSDAKQLTRATVFLTVLFGIGMLESLYSLLNYTRFVVSGITTDFPPLFLMIVSLLFFITHAAIIYFLFHYYRFKFTARQTNIPLEMT